ncbi:hypothetical protein [Tenacibaculum mesophilum]|uniref:hypothetical protein n=1 Tax=Tenacibaculum mesophilum TaxID=104268 RepID=UPI00374877C7
MNFEIYELSEDKEKEMWQNSTIIFDSSALLDFYFLPKKTREKIFTDLFSDKLNDRLWSPAQK